MVSNTQSVSCRGIVFILSVYIYYLALTKYALNDSLNVSAAFTFRPLFIELYQKDIRYQQLGRDDGFRETLIRKSASKRKSVRFEIEFKAQMCYCNENG